MNEYILCYSPYIAYYVIHSNHGNDSYRITEWILLTIYTYMYIVIHVIYVYYKL